MDKKKLILPILILLVVSIGAFFVFVKKDAKENEEEARDGIVVLLEIIEEESQVDFSDIQDSMFTWNMETSDGIMSINRFGKSFKKEDVSEEEYSRIEQFFSENGFVLDPYNIADGTVVSLRGYTKNKVSCIINKKYESEDFSSQSIEISCAF